MHSSGGAGSVGVVAASVAPVLPVRRSALDDSEGEQLFEEDSVSQSGAFDEPPEVASASLAVSPAASACVSTAASSSSGLVSPAVRARMLRDHERRLKEQRENDAKLVRNWWTGFPSYKGTAMQECRNGFSTCTGPTLSSLRAAWFCASNVGAIVAESGLLN